MGESISSIRPCQHTHAFSLSLSLFPTIIKGVPVVGAAKYIDDHQTGRVGGQVGVKVWTGVVRKSA